MLNTYQDAGKSTLSGQILYLSGMVDERTIQKYEREANDMKRGFIAYIMDTNDEERLKGITVEVGRAIAKTKKKRYTILDTPGHRNYVPNMISGVGQADVAILVISARKGEFEAGFEKNGQTREHALLARTLGVRKLILAINKMDDETVEWSKERYDEIYNKLCAYLKSVGFNTQKDVIPVPISGFSQINVLEKVDKKICSWYNGDSLLNTLDSLPPIPRNENGALRIPIVDRYKEMGTIYVHGKVEQGIVRGGQKLVVMPGSLPLEVLTVENDETRLKRARPGENIRLTVKGIDEEHLTRGFIICDPDHPIHSVSEFVAQLAIHDLSDTKSIFCAGLTCMLHSSSSTEEVTVVRLLAELDPRTQEIKKKLPNFVKNKSIVLVHLALTQSMCLETFKDVPQLGRFTLRSENKTIAFGKVMQLGPPKKKKITKV